jgi:outer membrane PBP1 activator LpoA protein
MQKYRISFFLLFFLFPVSSFANDTKMKIGVVAPLTGGLATIGNSLKNGIELSRSKNPEKFKNIEFFLKTISLMPSSLLLPIKN